MISRMSFTTNEKPTERKKKVLSLLITRVGQSRRKTFNVARKWRQEHNGFNGLEIDDITCNKFLNPCMYNKTTKRNANFKQKEI